MVIGLSWIFIGGNNLQAQDAVTLANVIASLKSHNFMILQVGVLTGGLSQAEVSELTELQIAPPRQMQILATQSTMIYDMYQDFTYLVNDKQVNAVIIYPSKISRDPSFIKKIGMMSRQKKIPVIAMEDAWVGSGAMLVYTHGETPTLHVNEQVRAVMKYPLSSDKLFAVELK
ncbi:MAG: hypothetical protein K9N34_09835 [Candidatus Marinimicrobia bacterium]|nr:hypothetical protein [Candidatus Neomarinimicrobiota bacterium]MCF7840887.1 hypothetical protein [Candidatus Neomarinimicrobiota bacterium]